MVPITGKLPRIRSGRTITATWGTRSAVGKATTLVLDSIGFGDETWLARGGFFHSDQMRVVEKFTRTGNTMLYEVTVDDPVMLVKPWVMPKIAMRLSTGNTIIRERGSCSETEHNNVSSQSRH